MAHIDPALPEGADEGEVARDECGPILESDHLKVTPRLGTLRGRRNGRKTTHVGDVDGAPEPIEVPLSNLGGQCDACSGVGPAQQFVVSMEVEVGVRSVRVDALT